ncbi:MAG: aminotransferase class V-fold PLP-dependent enzyme [Gemmatimonadaceae bacterium]
MDRRRFVASLATAGLALPTLKGRAFAQVARAAEVAANRPAAALAGDEAYWAEIQRAFDLDRTMVNLNNGGCSPAPSHVLEQMVRDLRFSNELPVDHMWRTLEPRIESVRRDLAREFGCDAEEMAITRNASESNLTMILGTDFARGDEVIVTTQNYPRMQSGWAQREARDGLVVKRLRMPTPVPSTEYFVSRLAEAITPRTRAIEVMHVNNQTGYVSPVREVGELGRRHGIPVFVDGAHAFAHFPFTRDELGCDYYGTSLHKWLLAPIGTGFLYVRRERIPSLWPLMAGAEQRMRNDIRKYEEIGTHPAANHNAISVALAFHRAIGVERKAARLRFLRDRWASRLVAADPGRVQMLAGVGPGVGGAIGTVAIAGLDMGRVGGWLLSKHRIVTTPIVHEEFNGLRVTPNVYTTLDEIDLFADRMLETLKQGIA